MQSGLYDILAIFSNRQAYVKWEFNIFPGMTTTITAVPGGVGYLKTQTEGKVRNGKSLKFGGGGRAKR